MEQSASWEANIHFDSQEIPYLLWNPKVHYCIHKSPLLVPVVSQMHPAHTFPPCFPKIRSDVTVTSMRRFYEWSLPFVFPNQNIVCISHLSHAFHLPVHLILLDSTTLTVFGEAYNYDASRVIPGKENNLHFNTIMV
jgi:hypothetical protein